MIDPPNAVAYHQFPQDKQVAIVGIVFWGVPPVLKPILQALASLF